MNKKWYSILDSVRFSISILLIGFILVGIGEYEATNEVINTITHITEYLGEQIVELFPFILVINYLGKTHKDITPVIAGIISFVLFNVISMFVSNGLYDSSYYTNILGLTYNGLKPINYGVLASLLVIIIVSFTYKVSRKRYNYGILRFIDNDVFFFIEVLLSTILVSLLLCAIEKRLVYSFNDLFGFISSNGSNPAVLFIYGIVDKTFSLIGLDGITKTQFLFGSLGGSWVNGTETVLGDINIWTAQAALGTVSKTIGRFTTPSYIINLFIAPSLLIGFFLNMNDKIERLKMVGLLVITLLACLLSASILPLEYVLLFTAPLLLVIHVLLCGSVYMVLAIMELYYGYSYSGSITSMSMGNIFDFVSGFNNVNYHSVIMNLIIVGAVYFVVYQIVIFVFYRVLSFDFLESSVRKNEVRNLIEALGGLANIRKVTSSATSMTVVLEDKEKINIDQLIDIRAYRVKERYFGYVVSFGAASTSICRAINKEIKSYQDCLKYSSK